MSKNHVSKNITPTNFFVHLLFTDALKRLPSKQKEFTGLMSAHRVDTLSDEKIEIVTDNWSNSRMILDDVIFRATYDAIEHYRDMLDDAYRTLFPIISEHLETCRDKNTQTSRLIFSKVFDSINALNFGENDKN